MSPGPGRSFLLGLLVLLAGRTLGANSWCRTGDARSFQIVDGTVLVREGAGVSALDPWSGEPLWRQELAAETTAGPLALGGEVAVGTGDAVVYLDRSTGRKLRSVAVGGRVERLVGPPLVAVVRVAGRAELWSMAAPGSVRATRVVGSDVFDVRARGGVVAAIVGLSDELPAEVAGFDAVTLREVWGGLHRGATRFYEVAEELVVHRFTVERGREFLPIAEESGSPKPPLPERAGTIGYAEVTWELQYRESEPSLRRSARGDGKRVWEVPIPGPPDAWTRCGDEVWLHAGDQLVGIDWRDGRTIGRITLQGSFDELIVHGGMAVVRGTDGELRGLALYSQAR